MANPEHVAVLKKGVDTWNKWRRESDVLRPDLSGADLSGTNLVSGEFIWTDFTHTNLIKADFRGANLTHADFREAILDHTDFSEADLTAADLRRVIIEQYVFFWGTRLWKSILSEAVIKEAIFSRADLTEADLSDIHLSKVRFDNANLTRTNLKAAKLEDVLFDDAEMIAANLSEAELRLVSFTNAELYAVNFSGAKLVGVHFDGASLVKANLAKAIVIDSNLSRIDLTEANLQGAWFERVNLQRATLVETRLNDTTLLDCRVYGASVWRPIVDGAVQKNLIITPEDAPIIKVDNLEVAQFIYLLLNNKNLRDIIDTVGNKAVLILGRFTDERKAVLYAIAEGLRKTEKYIPIIFDWTPPTTLDLTETVATLAHLSRFVIADLSDPNSIPHELMSFVEKLISVPVQPIFCPVPSHPNPYPMFRHILRYSHVLPLFPYETKEELIAQLPEKIIEPLEAKVREVRASI